VNSLSTLIDFRRQFDFQFSGTLPSKPKLNVAKNQQQPNNGQKAGKK